jgi:hypothetical protein
MAVSRDPTTPVQQGVTFEVERFAWAGGRLEVTGRWYGIRGRRFLRPTLDVEVDGGPRRMLAVLEHKPWAADDGEEWVAAFEWTGEPVEMAAAELAVAPELAVELPPPSGAPVKKARRARAAGQKVEARQPRAQALEAELAAAREEIEDLRGRLATEERARERRAEQVEELREETAAARGEAEGARDEAFAARDEAIAARDAVLAERDELVASRDAAAAERDEATAARDEAAAKAAGAAAALEKAVRKRAALETELAATAKARDKARAERNEWMTRAGAAGGPARPRQAEATKPPPDEPPAHQEDARRTQPLPAAPPTKAQIPPGGILLPPTGPGSHTRRSILPGWAPRVLAPVLLVVLLVVIALLIAWAF